MRKVSNLAIANIPDADRDVFERYGENVIGMVLAGGFAPAAGDLHALCGTGD